MKWRSSSYSLKSLTDVEREGNKSMLDKVGILQLMVFLSNTTIPTLRSITFCQLAWLPLIDELPSGHQIKIRKFSFHIELTSCSSLRPDIYTFDIFIYNICIAFIYSTNLKIKDKNKMNKAISKMRGKSP